MFIEVTSTTLRAHPKQALSTARQPGRGVLEQQRRPAEADQEIFAAPACPAGICHGEVRPLFGWIPSPPKNVGRSGQQMS